LCDQTGRAGAGDLRCGFAALQLRVAFGYPVAGKQPRKVRLVGGLEEHTGGAAAERNGEQLLDRQGA
jgi:hypothetical protein